MKKDYMDELLSDAIKTALDYSLEVVIYKRIIMMMALVICVLIAGYFL